MRLIILLCILIGIIYYQNGGFHFGGKASENHTIVSDAPVANQANLLKEPLQKNLSGGQGVNYGKGRLKFVAEYEITARVLGRKNYHGDYESNISPLDLALGWGKMSDPAVISKLSITQGGRFYNYHWSNAPPIPVNEIVKSSANVHLVPANKDVKASFDAIKRGQIVTLKGYLVDYREEDKNSWWAWATSRTRADSGKGACELIYVEHVVAY